MTLARAVYKLMIPGVQYSIDDLHKMLLDLMDQYHEMVIDGKVSIEEALDEEWFAAAEGANVKEKIKQALKVTRDFGYTKVNVEVTPAFEKEVTNRYIDRHGIGHSYKKILHYDEFKKFTYVRVK